MPNMLPIVSLTAVQAPPLDCHSLPGALQWAQLLSSGLPAVKAAGQAQPRDRWLWPWVWLTQSRLFGAEQRRGGFIRVKVSWFSVCGHHMASDSAGHRCIFAQQLLRRGLCLCQNLG